MAIRKPSSATYPQEIYDLLMLVLDEGEVTLEFPSPQPCWKTRKQIYGLRKALVEESHPRSAELQGISVAHNRDTFTLVLRSLETACSDGLAVVRNALSQTHSADHPSPSAVEPPSVPENPLERLLRDRNLIKGADQ